MIRFDDQVCVVTGAGRGLGRSYALLLAERGAKVLVNDAGTDGDGLGVDEQVADIVADEIRAAGGEAVADHTRLGSRESCHAVIAAALDAFGRVDALIHNAGIVVFERIEDVTEEQFDRVVSVNAQAAYWLAQAVWPHMKAQNYGRIVLTTTGHGMRPGVAPPGLTAYALGKMAQVGLMNGLIAEAGDADIHINAISPVAATRMLRRQMADGTFLPEQVAPAAVFLASSACKTSGLIVRGSNGEFAKAHIGVGDEITFEPGALSVEAIGDWLA